MKSTYLLHGGDNSLNSYSNFQFWRALADQAKGTNVLQIPFATSNAEIHGRDIYDILADDLKATLDFSNPHKDFYVESAYIDDIEHQLREAHIIYVHGGNGDLLQYTLKDVDLKGLVSEDKVIAGASAGANMWASCYYSNDNDAVCDGFGLLPVKTFCHYETYKWRNLNKLIKAKKNLPVITLSDNDFVML